MEYLTPPEHVSISALKAVHERTHPGAGNRPPRTPWPPQQHAHEPLSDLAELDDGDGGIDGWDRHAAALLAELEADEPDT